MHRPSRWHVLALALLLLVLVQSVSALPSQAADRVILVRYTVEFGDSYTSIASRYGLAPAALRSLPTSSKEVPRVGTSLELALRPPPAPRGLVAQKGMCLHRVAPGETLFAIGRAYQADPYWLASLNFLYNPNYIVVGQILRVPCRVPPPPAPTAAPAPSGPLAPQCVGSTVHVVSPGENLFRISLRYGTTVYALAIRNRIPNPNLIRVGQRLLVPCPPVKAPSGLPVPIVGGPAATQTPTLSVQQPTGPVATATAPPPTATRVSPTATMALPAATLPPLPPTVTSVPPSATLPPPTATRIPPTATPVPPTATRVPPSATPIPPTATRVPPSATPAPPTATRVPPSATLVPPTATRVPPSATPAPPTATWTAIPPTTAPTTGPTLDPALIATAAPAPAQLVNIENLAFTPFVLPVSVGTQVTWRNNEKSNVAHTVTSGLCSATGCTPNGQFDSGVLMPGQTFTVRFTAPGNYAYFCAIHGNTMTGVIIVR